MRWTVKKTDGIWYASCLTTGESVPVESLQAGMEYARDRLLGSEATA